MADVGRAAHRHCAGRRAGEVAGGATHEGETLVGIIAAGASKADP
jgi:hypothetical protein